MTAAQLVKASDLRALADLIRRCQAKALRLGLVVESVKLGASAQRVEMRAKTADEALTAAGSENED